VRHLIADHPGGHPGGSPGRLRKPGARGRMQTTDRVEVQRRLKELQEEHRRALGEGDIEALNRVQEELAELMKREPRGGPSGHWLTMLVNHR
jgi:hypothetical protein